jgi:hypothetical protein
MTRFHGSQFGLGPERRVVIETGRRYKVVPLNWRKLKHRDAAGVLTKIYDTKHGSDAGPHAAHAGPPFMPDQGWLLLDSTRRHVRVDLSDLVPETLREGETSPEPVGPKKVLPQPGAPLDPVPPSFAALATPSIEGLVDALAEQAAAEMRETGGTEVPPLQDVVRRAFEGMSRALAHRGTSFALEVERRNAVFHALAKLSGAPDHTRVVTIADLAAATAGVMPKVLYRVLRELEAEGVVELIARRPEEAASTRGLPHARLGLVTAVKVSAPRASATIAT